MDRRTFLRALAAVAGVSAVGVAAGETAAHLGGPHAQPSGAKTRAKQPDVREVDGLPIASWVVEENARPGSLDWAIHPKNSSGSALAPYPAPIEGYVDKVSYQQGDKLTLFVSTTAPHFRADVYRIGYYQGLGGRRLYSTAELVGKRQAVPAPTAGVNMIECDWQPSITLDVGADWKPGAYLIKLVSGRGARAHVPFTVRDDSSHATIVIQSSVTTWQAYNLWGGYSLYGGGASGALADRSRVVSFDRPYRNPDRNGSGDFLGNEFPFIYLAEKLGLDVTYWTDVDLHERPSLLGHHRCLVSLGHDEYWSWEMRFPGVSDHLARGVNLAFLGANASYRQIRFEDSPLGSNRRVVCYKDATADPIFASQPQLATGDSWSTDPVPYPESELIGVMYQSFGANAPFIVANASSWVYAGTGLRDGEAITGKSGSLHVVGSEFDGFEPRLSGPKNVEILAHSPTSSVSGQLYSDASYYTHAGGGGVFATGTASWVTLLWNGERPLNDHLGFGISFAAPPLTRITLNVLKVFAKGPAAEQHPSTANWTRFYSASAPVVPSRDVP